MSNKNDISDLISDAENQIETGTEKARRTKPRRRTHLNIKLIMPLVLLGLAFYIYSSNRRVMPDNLVIAKELTTLVTEARRLVEANIVDGEFPPVLPNAALGAIVQYDRVGNSYILSASISGVFVEVNEAGELTVLGVTN